MNDRTRSLRVALATAACALLVLPAQAQRMSGEETIDALTGGGYVLVMRHAPASLEAARRQPAGGGFGFGGGRRGGGAPPPEPTEEALDQEGIEMLTGMRHAIWHFRIPIGAIYASPARRTTQHANEIPFAEIVTVDDLGLNGAGSGWLARKLTEPPMAGKNTVIVTHSTNIANDLGIDVAEGETLIVRPGDTLTLVGRLGLREWSTLAIEPGD